MKFGERVEKHEKANISYCIDWKDSTNWVLTVGKGLIKTPIITNGSLDKITVNSFQ